MAGNQHTPAPSALQSLGFRVSSSAPVGSKLIEAIFSASVRISTSVQHASLLSCHCPQMGFLGN